MQRPEDGYMNATAMCQATVKQFADYNRLSATTAFLTALSTDMGIPISELIQTVRGGNGQQGTWVHPHVAIHLAQWLSPEFAVKVSRWVFEWMGQGKSNLSQHPDFISIHKSALDTGACIVTPNSYGSVTATPVSPEAIALMPALSTFLEAAKRCGFLLVKPDQLVQKTNPSLGVLRFVARVSRSISSSCSKMNTKWSTSSAMSKWHGTKWINGQVVSLSFSAASWHCVISAVLKMC
ncbi:KilA-N domain-containing protein [Thiothrix eikelboomii]|uniref:KilA-N domain-containing protein n=2 Tax=Thiothrix eikelboomii TaxID=92487 RepID=A0A1T4XKY8_9GAMM|nr:KilA-N domain-containing protein [Thiothrix eikelboomii]